MLLLLPALGRPAAAAAAERGDVRRGPRPGAAQPRPDVNPEQLRGGQEPDLQVRSLTPAVNNNHDHHGPGAGGAGGASSRSHDPDSHDHDHHGKTRAEEQIWN
jgi:hypothetical protein